MVEKTNHDTNAKKCGNCRYCGSTQSGGKEISFVCRKNRPQVFAQVLPTDKGLQWDVHGFWPPVLKDDWCGEFEPQLH